MSKTSHEDEITRMLACQSRLDKLECLMATRQLAACSKIKEGRQDLGCLSCVASLYLKFLCDFLKFERYDYLFALWIPVISDDHLMANSENCL